ncbi:ATP-binding cassette domain-containing protein [Streptomyces sp. NPDC101166]|uniref:ABC transporter ATP-binding protein n=1 Tax=Streptomyces sp. NPDC101166 TaxID=3366120 RepID=UPI003818C4F3
MTAAVVTRGLTRSYRTGKGDTARTVHALDALDLTVEPGEVRGLLGPNGAGKTTLCRILSTVLLPTSGTATVLGHDVVADPLAVKHSVGIVFGGEKGLYGKLTARQNLAFWAALYGLRGKALRLRVDALLERTGLADRAEERVDTFSRGMKQRLHLTRGMVAESPVLILDEPTAGMDPVAARDFRVLVAELRTERRTLLITTHDMAEATAVCDRVSLIDRGGLLVTDTPDAIGSLVSRHERIDAVGVPDVLWAELPATPGVISAVRLDDATQRIETDGTLATARVLQRLVAAGVTRISTGRPSLEEVYLHVMGDRGMSVSR